jgi:collagenase-like PrtC family protease
MLNTREKQEFLVFNGTQTQSAKVYNLIGAVPEMQTLGVDVLRLSPQSLNMTEVIGLFDDVRCGRLDAQQAAASLESLLPAPSCNGYWYGQPGLDQVQAPAAAIAA